MIRPLAFVFPPLGPSPLAPSPLEPSSRGRLPRRMALSLLLLLGFGVPLASPGWAQGASRGASPMWAQAPAGVTPLPGPGVGPGPGAGAGRGPVPPRLSEAQQRRIFPEIRRLAVDDHRARIAILQQGERCSRQAADGDGLRACMRQERARMQSQRQQHRDAVRAVMARNGVVLPEGKRWGRAGGGAPEGGPEGWRQPRQSMPPGGNPGGTLWR
jgi:hypothetical protein